MTRPPAQARSRYVQSHQSIYLERQHLRLDDFACASGWILDIGGGGDGIIGLLKGDRVVSIDLSAAELARQANPALKVVMDAARLAFLDGTFNTAAAFFSLAYMAAEVQARVVSETYRVLAPGGRLLIWDTAMPAPPDDEKTHLMLPVTIELPDGRLVRTGYGVPLKPQGLAYFVNLLESAGFVVDEACLTGITLVHLVARKPTG